MTVPFDELTAGYRRELLAHCYRMTGSMQDAEDLVQETYLRAWRAFDRFEGRSSLRVWLYKIATMATLTALQARRRRPLPSGLMAPSDDPAAPPAPSLPGVPWLEPAPDGVLVNPDDDPAARVAAQEGIRLAFVAALQYLPPRQRAVLVLRDVLMLSAAETAQVLDTTAVAVNSALRRARAGLAAQRPTPDDLLDPDGEAARELVRRYVAAFERADVDELVRTLRADAALEMPPTPTWFAGREAVAAFLAAHVLGPPGRWRLQPVRANGQPAVLVRAAGDLSGGMAGGLHGVHLLTLTATGVQRIVTFNDPRIAAAFSPVPV